MAKEDLKVEIVPAVIKDVLQSFQDVMPNQLPKNLPLKRSIDHEFKLLLGVKPPTNAPYRMTPPKLAELQKQLEELLDACFIRLSKAPYGGPMLF